jgi:hypothetical protein
MLWGEKQVFFFKEKGIKLFFPQQEGKKAIKLFFSLIKLSREQFSLKM